MKALICGVSGQDGAYLAKYLLSKGYEVFGSSRDSQASIFPNLIKLGINKQVKTISIALNDFRSVLQAFAKTMPDEVYNLSGQSSVGLSFEQPVETMESISTGTLNLLEALRFTGHPTKLYSAGSSECFGEMNDSPADENSPFKPRSPYAVAKATAFWQVANYREAYRLFACTGILFNHESPLRPERFVTKKIISAACRIARGSRETLQLGNLNIIRDWGWAPEYVEAMWLMLQQPMAQDFVIATGTNYSLEKFVEQSFSYFGLNWKDFVKIDPTLLRPTDLAVSKANPNKARLILNWTARHEMTDVVRMMIEDQIENEKIANTSEDRQLNCQFQHRNSVKKLDLS